MRVSGARKTEADAGASLRSVGDHESAAELGGTLPHADEAEAARALGAVSAPVVLDFAPERAVVVETDAQSRVGGLRMPRDIVERLLENEV